MNDNYEAYPASSLNDEDKMAVQDNPSLELQHTTLSQLKAYMFGLIDTITFNLASGISDFAAGVLGYDAMNHTMTVGLEHGVQLQIGMEILRYTRDEGSLYGITNGDFVFLAAADDDDVQTVGLVDASLSARHAGVATSDFGAEYGYIVTNGVARDVPITGLIKGMPLFADPTVPGGKTNSQPSWPDHVIFIGAVIKDNGDGTGDIDVTPYIVQREVPTPVCLPSYTARPAKNTIENIHGGLVVLATGHDLGAADLVMNGLNGQGIGKLLLVLNAGTGIVGTITVTGTIHDRNTGVETPGSYDIDVNGLSIDSSAADINGVIVYDFVDSYGTDLWFAGDFTISSTDTDISDMDVYQVSYEQFNDARIILLDTIDLNYYSYGIDKMSAYLYTIIDGNGDKFTLQSPAGNAIAAHLADRMYRRRISDLGIQLAGSSDGIFVQVKWFGVNQFADAGIKVWANVIF